LQQQFNTLLPLAKAGILTTDVHINTTGSTGAGLLQKRHILVEIKQYVALQKLLNTNT
jgi:hypothetical protein